MNRTVLPILLMLAAALYLSHVLGVSRGIDQMSEATIRTINAYTVVGEDMREAVACEFDEPLKYVTLIMHWYDSNAEMYADYIALADDPMHEAIWGWSSCVWQPDDSWAACDIFVVKPDFVHADMNMDTIGHEILHGACGDYHE